MTLFRKNPFRRCRHHDQRLARWFLKECPDALFADALRCRAEQLRARLVKVLDGDCVNLFPCCHALLRYAQTKAMAMELRLAGKVEQARMLEADCEAVYDTMPRWCRW